MILDVHGVGYLVTVGARTLLELPRVGERARLYTYTYVREDALGLFGFLTADELTFFKLLLSVKGIGPKAGLAILSRAEIGVLKRAILKEDAPLLATVPGIGPKTAARVVYLRRVAPGCAARSLPVPVPRARAGRARP